jgi:glycogen debranching enzyme
VAVTGRDGVERRLMTACRPAPDAVRGQTLRWRVTLRRGHPQTIALRHVAADGARVRVPKPPAARPRRTAQQAAAARATRVTTDDELAGRILEQSFADLQMLRSQLGRESYYAAGIPWYATVFGRDTLLASIQMLAYDPQIAEQTLRLLARNLGSQVNAATEEEPGKVLHELRVGELANLGLLPFARYYGSVDSTPLFLCLLAEHADWSGDLELFHELADAVDAALEWIDRWGDRDGDGLLEYERGTPEGLLNQGWKDSPDGVPDARGNALQTPIALIEPQAYVVSAKRRLARLFARAGDGERAERLRRESTELQERIERFWLDREGFYSLALDGRKRPSRALASNQGHLLWSVAVAPERAAAVRDALMRPELFCGWGVRTLAASEPSFNPVGYHTGSVWPHDSALIAAGLRKYGYDDDFAAIFEGLLEAASQFPDYRLPELFGGFSRTEQAIPVPYPVACRPQAWAAGSIPYLLRVGLGLDPCGLERKLRIIRPSLPRWLNRLELKGLRMAESAIDLTFERNDGVVALADVQIEGDADVELVR